MSDSLAIFSRAALMLAEADTLQKAKELKSLALTAADWAKRKGMGEDAIQHCRSYALEAERKMGEMLIATERATANQYTNKSAESPIVTEQIPTLSDLGLTKNESAKAQQLATIPRLKFESITSGVKTRTEVVREIARANASQKVAEFPSDKYRVIYADPPWKYGDTRNGLNGTTGAEAHYPTMSISELCALPVVEWAEPDAVLFLWVTSPLLFECLPVIKAWGFEYKACFIWDKIKHNLGHYNSVRHEFLLVCTRGSCTPDVMKLFDSVQSIERKEHSAKPEEFRDIIQTLYPNGKRIEVFARRKVNGWEAYGNHC